MVGANSKDDLIRFLDYTAERGLVKKPTVSSLKVACNTVFSILDQEEEADVCALDLDNVFRRFENLKGMDVRPGTLRSYRQRVTQAIADFQRFTADPSHWKPAVAQRSPKSNKSKTGTGDANQQELQPSNPPQTEPVAQIAADTIVHRFPLRRNAVVQISGVPYDINRSEATRLANFLHTLVAETPTSTSSPPMLTASEGEGM